MLVDDVGDAQKNRWDEKRKMTEKVNQRIKEKTGQKGVLKENMLRNIIRKDDWTTIDALNRSIIPLHCEW